jgi:hypothetical protein
MRSGEHAVRRVVGDQQLVALAQLEPRQGLHGLRSGAFVAVERHDDGDGGPVHGTGH